MSRIVKVGIIGLGARTETLLASFVGMNGVEVVAVCDLLEERIIKIVEILCYDRDYYITNYCGVPHVPEAFYKGNHGRIIERLNSDPLFKQRWSNGLKIKIKINIRRQLLMKKR